MYEIIEKESQMPKEGSEKPILVTRWITETRVYPSGKVVQRVFPTKGMAMGYAKKKNVLPDAEFKQSKEVQDL